MDSKPEGAEEHDYPEGSAEPRPTFKPIVGDIVHYYDGRRGPEAAIVTRVLPDSRRVDLTLFPPQCYARTTWANNVPPEGEEDASEHYWTELPL